VHIDCNEHIESYHSSTNALTLDAGIYTFVYMYPLSNDAEFTHQLDGNTTLHDILLLVKADYTCIYKTEEDAVGNPGTMPGMLNRATSTGPYGIWGHDLSDLYVEGININMTTKTVMFDIGS
jgi:hypothetical protein